MAAQIWLPNQSLDQLLNSKAELSSRSENHVRLVDSQFRSWRSPGQEQLLAWAMVLADKSGVFLEEKHQDMVVSQRRHWNNFPEVLRSRLAISSPSTDLWWVAITYTLKWLKNLPTPRYCLIQSKVLRLGLKACLHETVTWKRYIPRSVPFFGLASFGIEETGH